MARPTNCAVDWLKRREIVRLGVTRQPLTQTVRQIGANVIKKYGQVVITEDIVEVIGFHFDSSDDKNPCIEALEWAKQILSAKQRVQRTAIRLAKKCIFITNDVLPLKAVGTTRRR